MNTNSSKIHWSRRVSRDKIRRLYESDARGMLDEELLDDVGYGIYARCEDMLEVAEADRGRVKCRNCGNIIVRQEGEEAEHPGVGIVLGGGEAEMLECEQCSWHITWGEYCKSLRCMSMRASMCERLFQAFVRQWPSTQSPSAKLRLIDSLIHEFHVFDMAHGKELGGLVAPNVIQGATIAFMDALSYGAGSTPGLQDTRQNWLSRLRDKQRQLRVSDLQKIACELNIRGYSRMRKGELREAIERIDPERLESAQQIK